LLAIVEVAPEKRVQCGQPGCGHGVWKAIHVVSDAGEMLVLGSTCFERRYGSALALGAPSYGGGTGRKLTPEERQQLITNTAEFIAGMREEARRQEEELTRRRAEDAALAAEQAARVAEASALALERAAHSRAVAAELAAQAAVQAAARAAESTAAWVVAAAEQRARQARFAPATPTMPSWPWMKPGTSLGYFKLRDGSGWVRVQRQDGKHMLVPWPEVDGWDEAMPARLGVPYPALGGYLIHNVQDAVAFLTREGEPCRVFGSIRELTAASR
jgi:hypothetical protein